MTRDAYVYLMANTHNAVLSIGVTNDLLPRRPSWRQLGGPGVRRDERIR